MIDRYSILYSELKLMEYQLKQRVRGSRSLNTAFRINGGKRGFVKPEVFRKLIEGKKK